MTNSTKYLLFTGLLFGLISCGGGKSEEEFKFYTKKEVASKQLQLTVEASGTVEAISSIEIKSKASGEILFLGAEIGDFIKKGEVLARIDQRTPQNNLEQATADLDVAKVRLSNAESQFVRSQKLHNEGSISDKAFEDAQEAFSSAKSQYVRSNVFLENAKIALDDTLVRSPIDGTIISRAAEVGQVITSPTSAVGGGTLLMEMADLNKVRVRALIDEIDIGKITIGQEVTLRVSAYRDKKFTGLVSKIEPQAREDQNVTTFPVLIDIENKEFSLNEALIEKSSTPVTSPTLRGGVYFSDTHVYKIKGTVNDSTIIPLFSKIMLGPSTEFRDILVKTSAIVDSNKANITLHTHLTNSMQSSSKIELNLIIVEAEKTS